MRTANHSDVVVVGAGAAGLMTAIFAARAGVRVTVVDTRARPGAKIRISGGGRCNVLPSTVTPTDFHSAGSKPKMRNILMSWPLKEVHQFFETDLGVPLKVEKTGKVFPVSNESREVVSALMRALTASGAVLRAPYRVEDIAVSDDGFVLSDGASAPMTAGRVVLATGGLSIPKSGSDGGGIAIAKRLGHTIVPTYPALVPLLSSEPRWATLSGLSLDVDIRAVAAGKTVATASGGFLFTHRGFSGPAVLDISRHYTSGDGEVRFHVDWTGGAVKDWDAVLREGGAATVGTVARRHMPARLADALVSAAGADGSTRLGELKRDLRKRLVTAFGDFALPVNGSEGYRTAEVTGGGVTTDEITTDGLESRIVPGLHFVGEILDVTGRLGGYNFLWAWTSGRRAGEYIGQRFGGCDAG